MDGVEVVTRTPFKSELKHANHLPACHTEGEPVRDLRKAEGRQMPDALGLGAKGWVK